MIIIVQLKYRCFILFIQGGKKLLTRWLSQRKAKAPSARQRPQNKGLRGEKKGKICNASAQGKELVSARDFFFGTMLSMYYLFLRIQNGGGYYLIGRFLSSDRFLYVCWATSSQILDGFSVMCLMSVLACILANVFCIRTGTLVSLKKVMR